MAEPSKFGAILNLGYFRFLSISDCGEELELLFSAELKTNCLSLNMVYKNVSELQFCIPPGAFLSTHIIFQGKKSAKA